ncbi:MAG: alcohol acetyltransferase [Clostridiales bacterium]|nr:alcohol acetyltransferase [Clostridiales bacterium]
MGKSSREGTPMEGLAAARNENKWYRLDNAAKIYPAVTNAKRASVYRMSVELREKVDPETLQTALMQTLPRFPTFGVRMQQGLFWYYFEQNLKKASVFPERAPICRPIDLKETNGYLFRVNYYHARISLEVFHVLSDGTGAVAFLKALVFNYLALHGKPVVADDGILDGHVCPALSEIEDSFQRYYDQNAISSRAESKAYQLKGTRILPQYVRLTQGILRADAFKQLAGNSGSTVTEYTASLIIYAIYETQLKGRGSRQPVKISIPVNLRKHLESSTLRNFSSYVNVGMTFGSGDYTFERILEAIRDQLRNDVKKEKLLEKIGANVSAERSPFIRFAPLVLKNIALRTAYSLYGEKLITTTLSNIGVVRVPDSMKNAIKKIDFILGAPVMNAFSCAMCTFEDSMTISFTRIMEETDIERFFFRFLSGKGLDIVIESNYEASL